MRLGTMGMAATLAAVAACAAVGRTQVPSLVGRWEQEGADPHAGAPPARRQSFVFGADGSALWIFTTPERRDTFAIRYAFDASATPARLDLSGFAAGPLQGRTLYCIVDRAAAERFRMDCEPGRPGVDPETARPDAFTAQTVAYRRTP
jgi:hypothetical protein